jgi:hypothetical protein
VIILALTTQWTTSVPAQSAPQLATIHNVMALPSAVAFMTRGEMVAALGVGGAPGGEGRSLRPSWRREGPGPSSALS